MIQPIEFRWQDIAIGLGFGALLVASIYPNRNGIIDRQRCIMLLGSYVLFISILARLQAPG